MRCGGESLAWPQMAQRYLDVTNEVRQNWTLGVGYRKLGTWACYGRLVETQTRRRMNAGSRAHNEVSVCLSLGLEEDRLSALLTDTRSLQCFDACGVDLPGVIDLVGRVAGGSDAAAGLALFQAVLPPRIAAELRRLPPASGLTLQLSPLLDAIPWEGLSDGVLRIGHRFAVTRSIIDGDRPRPPASRMPAPSLQVACLHTGDLPVLGAGTRRVTWRPLSLSDLAGPDGVAVLSACAAVLCVGECDWSATAAAWPTSRDLRLLAVSARDSASLNALMREASRLGAVLVARVGAVSDESPAWFEALLSALGAGVSIAEAARRVRAAGWPDSGSDGDVRVYGAGDTALLSAELHGLGQGDRRQITALSFDMERSTALMGRIGEESYGRLVAQLHERCATVVRHFGGVSLDPRGNDGTMCYFGFPVAREGSARRAVRAAQSVALISAGLGLNVRAGASTGWVSVHGGQPFGRIIHLADRLQRVAVAGTVLVDEATQLLVCDHFETCELALPDEGLPGFDEPPRLFRVDGELLAVRSAAPRTPFIGRREEMGKLLLQWELAESGRGQVAVVTGEAGIGKTRLLHELRRSLSARGAEMLLATCQEDGVSSPFHTVVQSLRPLIGLNPSDNAASARAKIGEAMPVPGAETEGGDLDVLIELLGSVPQGAGSRSPERWRELALGALVRWFHAAALRRPFCLAIDDLQWADPSTRAFVDRLASVTARLPMLMVTSWRGDAESAGQLPPDWPRLELTGLREDNAQALVRGACPDATLPDSVVRLLVAQGDGVPLFLEESARMVNERGMPAGSVGLGIQVPGSIHDVLMRRLDRLGDAKPVAQLASVLGREFPAALLHAVLEASSGALRNQSASDDVDTLEAAGLLTRGQAAQGAVFRFKHALVRDVAYQSIWVDDRPSAHRIVTEVLRQRFDDLIRQRPEYLAHHQAAAGLDWDAVESWEAAARLAASRSAHREAVAHAEAALRHVEALPAGRGRDAAELRLLVLLASRQVAIEGYGAQRVEHAYLRAAALSEVLGDAATRSRIELGLEGYYFMRAELDRAEAIALSAVSQAAQAASPMQRLQANWALANVYWHQGRLLEALDGMDRCLAVYRPEFHRAAAVQDPGVMCLCYSAWGYWERGDATEALSRIRRVLVLTQELAHPFSSGEAHGFAASVHLFRGEFAEAMRHAELAISICTEGGFAVWLAHARMTRGRLLAQTGSHAAGLREMEEAYAMWIATGAIVTRPFYLAQRSEAHLLAGEPAQALRLLDEAMTTAERGGEHYHSAEILRLRAEALARDGTPAAAAAMPALAAWDRAREQGKLAFVLRAATTLARLLPGQESEARLRAALAALPAAGDTLDVRQALAQLPRSASAGP